jgi:hypothetical protein
VARDIQRIKTEGGASIGELREFVGRMQGKSPQEMLGVLAQSRLAISIVFSTVGCIVILFSWSILAYMWNGGDGKPATPAATAQNPDKPVKSAPAKTAAAKTSTVTGTSANTPSASKTADIAKRLGIKETKTGSPNIENLLDGDK